MNEPTALISERHPFYKELVEVFGGTSVPVTSYTPVINSADGLSGKHEFYKLDIKRLDDATIERVIQWLHKRTGAHMTREEVESRLYDPQHGLPLLSEYFTVAIPMKKFV